MRVLSRVRIGPKIISLLLVSGVFFSCMRNPVTKKREAHLISAEAEKRIGEKVRKQIIKEFGILPDEELRSYVMAVGQRIVEVSDRQNISYDFQILDTELVNALAVPGGFIFVTRGMLEELSDEAELASVLGHEVAHVAAYHSVNMIEKSMGFGFLKALAAVGAAIATGDPTAFYFVDTAASAFGNLFFLGYSRENELESDRVGLRYAVSAGYDPEGILSFFERLKQMEEEPESKWDVFFLTHPPTKDRIRLARALIKDLPPSVLKDGEEGFERYQEALSLLKVLDPKLAGRIDGTRYVNPAFDFTFDLPEGWRFNRNRRRALIGMSSTGRKAIGELRHHELQEWTEISSYVEQVVSDFKLKFISGRQVFYPSGYGYLGRFAGFLRGQYLEIRLLAVVRGTNGYVLALGAPHEEYERYLLDFERIMRSWRFKEAIE